MTVAELSPSDLCLSVSPAQLGFEDTSELLGLPLPWFGQERAETAARFGLQIRQPGYNLLVLVSVAIAMLLLTILFQRTNIGLALRASAYSPEIARLSGIKVDAVRTLGWAIAGASGGLAGMLYIPGYFLYPNAMDLLLVFGFVAAVIGGLESLFGAVAGAMILGFAINFSTTYISQKLFFPTAFIVLVLVLLIKPSGLFAAKKSRGA